MSWRVCCVCDGVFEGYTTGIYCHRCSYLNVDMGRRGAHKFNLTIPESDIECKDCASIISYNKIHIHHIYFNRANNNFSNFVMICGKCHSARHASRFKILSENYAKDIRIQKKLCEEQEDKSTRNV